jgi:hypothetical protein
MGIGLAGAIEKGVGAAASGAGKVAKGGVEVLKKTTPLGDVMANLFDEKTRQASLDALKESAKKNDLGIPLDLLLRAGDLTGSALEFFLKAGEGIYSNAKLLNAAIERFELNKWSKHSFRIADRPFTGDANDPRFADVEIDGEGKTGKLKIAFSELAPGAPNAPSTGDAVRRILKEAGSANRVDILNKFVMRWLQEQFKAVGLKFSLSDEKDWNFSINSWVYHNTLMRFYHIFGIGLVGEKDLAADTHALAVANGRTWHPPISPETSDNIFMERTNYKAIEQVTKNLWPQVQNSVKKDWKMRLSETPQWRNLGEKFAKGIPLFADGLQLEIDLTKIRDQIDPNSGLHVREHLGFNADGTVYDPKAAKAPPVQYFMREILPQIWQANPGLVKAFGPWSTTLNFPSGRNGASLIPILRNQLKSAYKFNTLDDVQRAGAVQSYQDAVRELQLNSGDTIFASAMIDLMIKVFFQYLDPENKFLAADLSQMEQERKTIEQLLEAQKYVQTDPSELAANFLYAIPDKEAGEITKLMEFGVPWDAGKKLPKKAKDGEPRLVNARTPIQMLSLAETVASGYGGDSEDNKVIQGLGNVVKGMATLASQLDKLPERFHPEVKKYLMTDNPQNDAVSSNMQLGYKYAYLSYMTSKFGSAPLTKGDVFELNFPDRAEKVPTGLKNWAQVITLWVQLYLQKNPQDLKKYQWLADDLSLPPNIAAAVSAGGVEVWQEALADFVIDNTEGRSGYGTQSADSLVFPWLMQLPGFSDTLKKRYEAIEANQPTDIPFQVELEGYAAQIAEATKKRNDGTPFEAQELVNLREKAKEAEELAKKLEGLYDKEVKFLSRYLQAMDPSKDAANYRKIQQLVLKLQEFQRHKGEIQRKLMNAAANLQDLAEGRSPGRRVGGMGDTQNPAKPLNADQLAIANMMQAVLVDVRQLFSPRSLQTLQYFFIGMWNTKIDPNNEFQDFITRVFPNLHAHLSKDALPQQAEQLEVIKWVTDLLAFLDERLEGVNPEQMEQTKRYFALMQEKIVKQFPLNNIPEDLKSLLNRLKSWPNPPQEELVLDEEPPSIPGELLADEEVVTEIEPIANADSSLLSQIKIKLGTRELSLSDIFAQLNVRTQSDLLVESERETLENMVAEFIQALNREISLANHEVIDNIDQIKPFLADLGEKLKTRHPDPEWAEMLQAWPQAERLKRAAAAERVLGILSRFMLTLRANGIIRSIEAFYTRSTREVHKFVEELIKACSDNLATLSAEEIADIKAYFNLIADDLSAARGRFSELSGEGKQRRAEIIARLRSWPSDQSNPSGDTGGKPPAPEAPKAAPQAPIAQQVTQQSPTPKPVAKPRVEVPKVETIPEVRVETPSNWNELSKQLNEEFKKYNFVFDLSSEKKTVVDYISILQKRLTETEKDKNYEVSKAYQRVDSAITTLLLQLTKKYAEVAQDEQFMKNMRQLGQVIQAILTEKGIQDQVLTHAINIENLNQRVQVLSSWPNSMLQQVSYSESDAPVELAKKIGIRTRSIDNLGYFASNVKGRVGRTNLTVWGVNEGPNKVAKYTDEQLRTALYNSLSRDGIDTGVLVLGSEVTLDRPRDAKGQGPGEWDLRIMQTPQGNFRLEMYTSTSNIQGDNRSGRSAFGVYLDATAVDYVKQMLSDPAKAVDFTKQLLIEVFGAKIKPHNLQLIAENTSEQYSAVELPQTVFFAGTEARAVNEQVQAPQKPKPAATAEQIQAERLAAITRQVRNNDKTLIPDRGTGGFADQLRGYGLAQRKNSPDQNKNESDEAYLQRIWPLVEALNNNREPKAQRTFNWWLATELFIRINKILQKYPEGDQFWNGFVMSKITDIATFSMQFTDMKDIGMQSSATVPLYTDPNLKGLEAAEVKARIAAVLDAMSPRKMEQPASQNPDSSKSRANIRKLMQDKRVFSGEQIKNFDYDTMLGFDFQMPQIVTNEYFDKLELAADLISTAVGAEEGSHKPGTPIWGLAAQVMIRYSRAKINFTVVNQTLTAPIPPAIKRLSLLFSPGMFNAPGKLSLDVMEFGRDQQIFEIGAAVATVVADINIATGRTNFSQTPQTSLNKFKNMKIGSEEWQRTYSEFTNNLVRLADPMYADLFIKQLEAFIAITPGENDTAYQKAQWDLLSKIKDNYKNIASRLAVADAATRATHVNGLPQVSKYLEKLGFYEQSDETDAKERIKKGYRKLSRLYHPDVKAHNPNVSDKERENDAARFKEINEAYEFLTDKLLS